MAVETNIASLRIHDPFPVALPFSRFLYLHRGLADTTQVMVPLLLIPMVVEDSMEDHLEQIQAKQTELIYNCFLSRSQNKRSCLVSLPSPYIVSYPPCI